MATARTIRLGNARHGHWTWRCTCGTPGGRYPDRPAADRGKQAHEAWHGRKTAT
jgi:hypothetical protein